MRTGIVLVVTGLLMTGCDLFPTRTPSGVEGGDSVWLTPVTPLIIVENLRTSFQAGNFGDYRRTMTEDFGFIPDQADAFDIELVRPGEEVFLGWDRDVETNTAERIFGGVAQLTLNLELLQVELLSEGRLLKYQYVLALSPAEGEPVLYEGEAWFWSRQDLGSGEWFIYQWEDVASVPLLRSWGYLKGLNRP